MSVFLGTQDGVYRSTTPALDSVERVLDTGPTLEIRSTDGHEVFAASKTGLYRSLDAGSSWDNLDVPQVEVYSVAVSPDGDRIYAGTHPAHIYVSTDDGKTWTDLSGFQELPSRNWWHTPRHRGASHVRSLGVHRNDPDRLVAGVEVGGIHVSDDGGRTWSERGPGLEFDRKNGLQFDVHHVLVLGADEYIASCGGGLFRTVDGGKRWTRLLADTNRPYFAESYYHNGTTYTSAQTLPPMLPLGSDYDPAGVNAVILESDDNGESFETMPYHGEPDEFVTAWCEDDGQLLAGTTEGRILTQSNRGWVTMQFVPSWVRSMTTTSIN